MIVRIVIAVFISVVTGVCYLAGMSRLISALLIGFGVLTSLFFALLFLLPPGSARASFALSAPGESWPFLLLALVLALMIGLLFYLRPDSEVPDGDDRWTDDKPREKTDWEPLCASHLQLLGGGVLFYLFSLFFPVFLWFPSEEAARSSVGRHPEMTVLIGVVIFICGISLALYALFRAAKGGTPDNPYLMRTAVPALFTVFHLDKIPALAAYLLIYSTNPELVFPKIAALALAGYIPVSWFLIKTVPPPSSPS